MKIKTNKVKQRSQNVAPDTIQITHVGQSEDIKNNILNLDIYKTTLIFFVIALILKTFQICNALIECHVFITHVMYK
jgi:hypothetical protein